jgi:hypothetical protein
MPRGALMHDDRRLPNPVSRALILLVCGAAHIFAGSDLARDIRDLRQLQAWRASDVSSKGAPDQSCEITNLTRYKTLRLDLQLRPEVRDADANSRINALDSTVTSFLANRGWLRMKTERNSIGIPDLTRCFQKQAAVAQIYKTTGRCTMNSPCTAYDGFAVVLYLPKSHITGKNQGQ